MLNTDMVMVPREPTAEMRRVGADVWHLHDGHLTRVIGDVYRAMIAAAPAPVVREPLTDEQIRRIGMSMPVEHQFHSRAFARAIERAHGIGTTGGGK